MPYASPQKQVDLCTTVMHLDCYANSCNTQEHTRWLADGCMRITRDYCEHASRHERLCMFIGCWNVLNNVGSIVPNYSEIIWNIAYQLTNAIRELNACAFADLELLLGMHTFHDAGWDCHPFFAFASSKATMCCQTESPKKNEARGKHALTNQKHIGNHWPQIWCANVLLSQVLTLYDSHVACMLMPWPTYLGLQSPCLSSATMYPQGKTYSCEAGPCHQAA